MSAMCTVLIVEDDAAIGNFISSVLRTNGFATLYAKNGQEALMQITSRCPDLVILDLGLPDADGTQIIRQVRQWTAMPIVVVSARTHERDKVQALDLGADDYITKPFGTAELLARVRTALRHVTLGGAAGTPEKPFTAGNLTVHYDKRRVYIGDRDAGLTQNEYKIVSFLARNAGKVLTYDSIIKAVWGPNLTGDNQILRVNMANIRRKIEENPGQPMYIITEIGVGYRMADPD